MAENEAPWRKMAVVTAIAEPARSQRYILIGESGDISHPEFGDVLKQGQLQQILGGGFEMFRSGKLPGVTLWMNASKAANGTSINAIASVLMERPLYGPILFSRTSVRTLGLSEKQLHVLAAELENAGEECRRLLRSGELDARCRQIRETDRARRAGM